MRERPVRHPLTVLRASLGLTAGQYLARLDEAHHALGHGRMARRREKVTRWETGVHTPDAHAQAAMAHLHGIPPDVIAELGWPGFLLRAFTDDDLVLCGPWTPAGTVAAVAIAAQGGALDRRGFLISSGAALTGIIADWSGALPDLPIIHPSGRQLTLSMVTRLEQRLDDLRHLDDVLGSSQLRPSALAENTLLSNLAQQARYDDETGRRLFSALAESSRLCGWLYFDAGLHAAAQRFYVTALRASSSAGDVQVGANTLQFMAIQTYSVGSPQDAVNLVRAAQAQVRGRTTGRVRARLHARAARALSKVGDLQGCARELEAARDAYTSGSHDDDPAWVYSLTVPEIEMLSGSCALDLGDPARALHHFAAARQADYATAGHARDSVLYLARAAQAHLKLGDLDAACATASEALAQNAGVDSSRSFEPLNDLRDALAAHRDVPVVREFLSLGA